ncbi:hypothetical protein [Fournierella sp.]|uniref:hypothetical protein n=1 Tax=Allofournierella sp. TaxID=1940256 RepID=UPI00117BD225
MNQKAQASLGGLTSIFGKFHRKFWRDTPPEAFAVNCVVVPQGKTTEDSALGRCNKKYSYFIGGSLS